MLKLDKFSEKWKTITEKKTVKPRKNDRPADNIEQQDEKKPLSVYGKIKRVLGIIIMCVYRLRKVVLAVPVAYYALKLARYNMENLPEHVGINLQSNGVFTTLISRNTAVTVPLAVTAVCLVLMFCSRKALPTWAISVFSLVIPVVLLLSNIYPA